MEDQGPKPKHEHSPEMFIPHIYLDSVKNNPATMSSSSTSMPSTPTGFRKTNIAKYNCLCSPTNHAGSFRCRYHRNSGLVRNSVSVGAKLSELAGKRPGMYDPLHAQ